MAGTPPGSVATELRDIHLPPSPSWWPPAPGWWLLAIASLLAVAWIAWRATRAWRARRLRQRLLEGFDAELASAPDAPARLAAASQWLRRAARTRAPEAAVLAGDAWLDWLDGTDAARPFSRGPGRLLVDGAFRASIEGDVAAVLALARSRLAALMDPAHA